jgi:hypothetical protein
MPWPPTRRDHLYVIASSCGHVKIGRSVDVAARLKSLLRQAPPSVDMHLVVAIDGFGAHEHTLHEAFAEHRVRGEWFTAAVGDEIRRLVAEDRLRTYIVEAARRHAERGYIARTAQLASSNERTLLAKIV